MTLFVSASTLDSFKLCCEEEWKTVESLEAQIRGLREDSRTMQIGRALQAVVADPDRYCHPDLDDDAVAFLVPATAIDAPEDVMLPGLPLTSVHRLFPIYGASKATFEPQPSARLEVDVNGQRVSIGMRADVLYGRRGGEFKSAASFDFDSYADALQWRLYALAYDLLELRYFVWQLYDGAHGLTFKGLHEFSVFPYPGMLADITPWVEHFVGFVEDRKLAQYLQGRA